MGWIPSEYKCERCKESPVNPMNQLCHPCENVKDEAESWLSYNSKPWQKLKEQATALNSSFKNDDLTLTQYKCYRDKWVAAVTKQRQKENFKVLKELGDC